MAKKKHSRIELGMEVVNRQKPESKQPRFSDDDKTTRIFHSIMRWYEGTLQDEPPYKVQSTTRDKWLSTAWMVEPHLSGVVNSVTSIDKNRGWTLTGGRNQVSKYTRILHNYSVAPYVDGWRMGINASSLSYYSTDMGSIIEMGRDGVNGPMRALYHLDPARCQLTGDMDYPLAYTPHNGNAQAWEPMDYIRQVSMPSIDEEFNGLGFCALSRCIELTKIMVAVYEHDIERLGAKAPKGLLLLSGVDQEQWNDSLEIREAQQEGKRLDYFKAVAVLASSGMEQIDAKLIAMSELPSNFDLQTFTSLLMYGYALCFGYDPSEFYPVQFGSLGRGTEMEVQHEKATVKGKLDFAYSLQEHLQGELPETVTFEFDEKDEAGELMHANTLKAYADLVATMRGTGLGDLTMIEGRQLWAEYGLIPLEWTEFDEDVEVEDTEKEVEDEEKPEAEAEDTDTEDVEPEPVGDEETRDYLHRLLVTVSRERKRDRLMANASIARAAVQFPDEPIVRYHWPTNHTQILWESGSALLKRKLYPVTRKNLYNLDDIVITDEDVEEAIEEGEDRLGKEFESLLLGEESNE